MIMQEAAVDVSAAKNLALLSFPAGNVYKFVLFDPSAAKASFKPFVGQQVRLNGPLANSPEAAMLSAVKGYIALKKPTTETQWHAAEVTASAAEKGYGPLIYDVAMSKLDWITSDRHSVSPEAEKIWAFYKNRRPDVNKLEFDDVNDPRTPPKEDDAVLHVDGAKNPLNYAYGGVDVDATRLEKNYENFEKWAIKTLKINVEQLSGVVWRAGRMLFHNKFV